MPISGFLRSPARLVATALLASAFLPLCQPKADAGEVRVAVAANFTAAAKEIGTAFQNATGHSATFSFGSTGQLYTQISQEAPFEVFMAADEERPRMAAENGLALADSRITYAMGRIALFAKDPALVSGEETLESGNFTRIAIANPVTAPYGSAAVETMKTLGVYAALKPKFVLGTNIAQTYQFVDTGNAEIGFVALSQIAGHTGGSRWIVPQRLHTPLAQDAVLLKRGEENEAARAFLDFLQGPEARAIKEGYGYGSGD